MKFVKQHSWEQEWADTLRQEKAYLQKNLHKKDSALNRTLEERIPDTLQAVSYTHLAPPTGRSWRQF